MGLFSKISLAEVEAADRGVPYSQEKLQKAFDAGLTADEHNELRRKVYLPKARSGDPFAQYWMGFLSSMVDRDPKQTVYWLERSANQGNVDAMRLLFMGYNWGCNEHRNELSYVPFGYDPEKELFWLKRAADHGDEIAISELRSRGYKYERDEEQIAFLNHVADLKSKANKKVFLGGLFDAIDAVENIVTILGSLFTIVLFICIVIFCFRSCNHQTGKDMDYVPPSSYVENIGPISTSNPYYDCRAVYGESILPDSDSRYYEKSELAHLDKQELTIARNEIYARHGYIFKSENLAEYFEACDWYSGTVSSSNFSESVFNKYEKANIKTITECEKNADNRS